MKFISIRDLRSNTKRLKAWLDREEKLVLLSNGKPMALLTRISEDDFEDRLNAVNKGRAWAALDLIREKARQSGIDKMKVSEIDKAISDTRRGLKKAGTRK